MTCICEKCATPVNPFTLFCVHCGQWVKIKSESPSKPNQKSKDLALSSKSKNRKNNEKINIKTQENNLHKINNMYGQSYIKNNHSYYGLYTLKGMHIKQSHS